MNYEKGSLIRKKKAISSKRNLQKKRVGVRLFKALVVCIILACFVAVGSVGFFVQNIIASTPVISPSDVLPAGEASFAYAADGTLIQQFVAEGSNRISVTLDEIPDYLQHAFIAIEDERFLSHNGIDLQGIARAGVVGVTSGNFTEGASTITQQLIKNNVFTEFMYEDGFMDSLERKLQEIYLALEIEEHMNKNEILEAYLNTINLGQNTLGVQSAAQRYFNKDVTDLTLSESAVIAAITQSPSTLDPVDNPDANRLRMRHILGNMYEQNFITAAQRDEALADNVFDRVLPYAIVNDEVEPYSYFVDVVARHVMRDLRERRGLTAAQAHHLLYSGGLTIHTTQDLRIQRIATEEVQNDANFPMGTQWGLDYALTINRAGGEVEHHSIEMLAQFIRVNWGREFPLLFSSQEEALQAIEAYKANLSIGEDDTEIYRIDLTPQPQASVTVMEQASGHVMAVVGGRGEKTGTLSLNRAYDTTRQPGSTFKLPAVYAPAIDSHGYTLATMVDDAPFEYESGQRVRNWDGQYRGDSSIRFAIEHSMNVVAVKTLTEIGLQTGFDYLKRFGFTTLVNHDDPDLPGFTDVAQATALGGITRGVTNVEMTAAYAAIANGGVYIPPIFYTTVLDRDGNVILDNTNPERRQVIQDSTAALLTSAMEDVINIGTGTTARMSNMPVAGKTGTTEWSTDLWLSAYTPYFTTSVWGGFDTNFPMEGMDQAWHMVIWRNINERIHEGMASRPFIMPPSVESVSICRVSGLRAGPNCDSFTEYFAIGTVPAQVCHGHGDRNNDRDRDRDDDRDDDDDENNDDDQNGSDDSDNNQSSPEPPAEPSPEPPPPPPPEPSPEPPPEPPPEGGDG
ncbi:MAG: PBP1A family penicillin-binding protein [Lachnospiraceae bacterium]|nr:PBP1A family penicillin-binding protein [Lachnospiraceae bacterium]